MTVFEYLQSLDLETRMAVVGCADNALRGIRNLDEQTAAAASFGLWACPDYLAQQLGLAFNCNYPASTDAKYYTTARLLYRLHKITADQVWAYTESDPPKITEDEALAICGPRAKDETAGS